MAFPLPLTLSLDINDLISYCQTSKEASKVCQDPSFWRLKYKQDFGVDPEQDKIAVALGLDEHMAYIRKYTYMGGLTYGSEYFLAINRIFIPALQQRNRRLVYHYMAYLRKLDRITSSGIRQQIIYWYDAIKEALMAGYLDIAEELEQIEEKYNYIPHQRVTDLMRGVRGEELVTHTQDYILGALFVQDYDLAEKAIAPLLQPDSIDGLRGLHKEVFALGELEWIVRIFPKDTHYLTDDYLLNQYILAGQPIYADEIPVSLDPTEVVDTMIYAKNYNLDYIRENKDKLDLSTLQIPCALGDILDRVDDLSGCTPQEYEKWRKSLKRPPREILTDILSSDNWELVDYLIQRGFARKDRGYIPRFLEILGYKDIWFYLYKLGFSIPPDEERGSVEMKKFMLLAQGNKNLSFMEVNLLIGGA
jgi:hypothetical protein